jgi:3-oxoacyl-[acyl-carrier-protein] synthase III
VSQNIAARHGGAAVSALEPGKLVAMTTFGAGFSWSCAVARW